LGIRCFCRQSTVRRLESKRMIPIKKDLVNIPDYLNSNWAQVAFKHNASIQKYEKGDYGHEDIQEELIKIYHTKCAYCEGKIIVTGYQRIDHYRPKAKYYWLALSWSNLLFACEICNNKKDDEFDTTNQQLNYKGETLDDLHRKASDYDKLEIPFLINPEQETASSLNTHFSFNINSAEIIAKSMRMDYTIRTCGLNRKGLIDDRIEIRNDLENAIISRINKSYPDLQSALNDLLDDERKKAIPERDYTAWRRAICANFSVLVAKYLKSV